MTNLGIINQIINLARHGIPYHAYGDNEAGCELARRLDKINHLCAELKLNDARHTKNAFGDSNAV